MTRPDPADEARRWLRFADEDLAAAETELASGRFRIACSLAQQAAEKAIKTALVYEQVDFPKTHDLPTLRVRVPEGWTIKEVGADLELLSKWGVEGRYPGDWPEATEADAGKAIADARAVLEAVRIDLNLRVA